MGDGTDWLFVSLVAPAAPPAPGFEAKLPTGDGECGAEDVFSMPEVAAEAGIPWGLADLRADAMTLDVDETEDVMSESGSVDAPLAAGIAPGGGGGATPAAEAVDEAEIPDPEAPVGARITAAAALGAEKLVKGTSGVWNTPAKKRETKLN